jgi:hypothetical protein
VPYLIRFPLRADTIDDEYRLAFMKDVKFSVTQVHRTDITEVAKTVPGVWADESELKPVWVLIMYTSAPVVHITYEAIANLESYNETLVHIPVASGPQMKNICPHADDVATEYTRSSKEQGWYNKGYLSYTFWELIHSFMNIEVS